MNGVSILDCTLRDGGYLNNWHFGSNVIRGILRKLAQSRVDIIECGFLRECAYDPECSVFSDIGQISPLIYPKQDGIAYVAMIAVGDIDTAKIAPRQSDSIDGIRLTFHRHEWEETSRAARELMGKGYQAFIQPVGTTGYSDLELLTLVEKVNEARPTAFYLVDTLGIMYAGDVLRMFNLVDNNLHAEIAVGFHSHNNLQLSFSNAQTLLRAPTRRNIIIDSSVFGMGRAAGNLCTELIARYVNDNIAERYDIALMLEIVDDYLTAIHYRTPWGYSVPYYLAAVGGIHPNYATYLLDKETIRVGVIAALLDQIPAEKRQLYDVDTIENLYLRHQANFINDSESIGRLGKLVPRERPILVLAPGKSLRTEERSIKAFISERDPFVVTVNLLDECWAPDLCFFSNEKRLERAFLPLKPYRCPVIVTSNLAKHLAGQEALLVDYSSLLGRDSETDNAGIMLLRLLGKIGVKLAYLAGFDGFSDQGDGNFYSEDLQKPMNREIAVRRNSGIQAQLLLVEKQMKLHFLTPTHYTQE